MKPSNLLQRSLSAFLTILLAIGATTSSVSAANASAVAVSKPVIVLVHGAFVDSSVWNSVIARLQHDEYSVMAAATPLRGLQSDVRYLSTLLDTIHRPVVLVGNSYGGSVITDAAVGHANVKALVYVAALAPDQGESAFDLVGKFPGSLLGNALMPPVALADGSHDLYVQPTHFRAALAADVPQAATSLMAVAQRPVTDKALKGASGSPAWRNIPSWFVYGSADESIPPAVHAYMAKRAHARSVVVVKGAPHLLMVSHPAIVARAIEAAATAVGP